MTKAKAILLAIAAFASAIAKTAGELADDPTYNNAGTPDATPTGDTAAPPTRRGRAPKTEPPAEPAAAGKPESELRELIRPLVEEQGRGAEVKALITKLGGTSLSTLPADKHSEFIRSIEALLI